MQKVKEVQGLSIFKKRSGRFAVQGKDKKWVNGPDKVRILVEQGLVKAAVPKKAEEAPAEAAASAETAPE